MFFLERCKTCSKAVFRLVYFEIQSEKRIRLWFVVCLLGSGRHNWTIDFGVIHLVLQTKTWKFESKFVKFLYSQSGLIRFITNKTQSNIVGYFLCALLFIRLNLSTFCLHHGFHSAFLVGIRTRNSLMSLIYKKVKKNFNPKYSKIDISKMSIFGSIIATSLEFEAFERLAKTNHNWRDTKSNAGEFSIGRDVLAPRSRALVGSTSDSNRVRTRLVLHRLGHVCWPLRFSARHTLQSSHFVSIQQIRD